MMTLSLLLLAQLASQPAELFMSCSCTLYKTVCLWVCLSVCDVECCHKS